MPLLSHYCVTPAESKLLDLKDGDALRGACVNLIEQVVSLPGNQRWITDFQQWLVRIHDVSHEEFVSEEFQLSLWNSEAV